MKTKFQGQITLGKSLFVIAFLIVSLISTILVFEGAPHIPLLVSTIVASLVAISCGYKWKEIEEGIVDTIRMSMQAILIVMIIGGIIGTWILAGIVPTMIYYGLKILSPGIFLVASCIMCAIVSLATGSSWTTIGTVGIALIGVGGGLGIPEPMVAGAIISGAYFGDKMSPLSDTTNLAPAMAGADLFDHIKHMVFTTGPSLLIALILYGVLGMKYAGQELNVAGINTLLETLSQQFTITPLLLIPPVLVILMVVFRAPAIPGLIGGTVLGGVFAAIFQKAGISAIIAAAHYGYSSSTGVEAVDNLLSRGGINGMMWTVSLILIALSFCGTMEKTGMIRVIVERVLQFAHNTGSLVTATILTCIFTNYTTGVQYVALVIPGRMYKDAYQRIGLHPKNLSRALEDSGTLVAPLVPWSTDGAFISGALGILPLAYIPFAFLNLINPLVSIFYGFTGITMEKFLTEEKTA